MGLQKVGGDGAGEFFAADGIDTTSSKTAGVRSRRHSRIDDGLDEEFFFIGSGLVLGDEDLAELFVSGDIIIWQ